MLEGSPRGGPPPKPALVTTWQLAAIGFVLVLGAFAAAGPILRPALHGLPPLRRAEPVPQCPEPPAPQAASPAPKPQLQRASKLLPVPWEPILTADERQRGMTYYGSGRRLDRLVAKLEAGEPISAITIGGSVTRGGGATDFKFAFAERLFSFINASWPHSDHTFVNKGIGASTSFLFAPCLKHQVPSDVDLVVVEFTVNDEQEAPMTHPNRRSYEQILRQLHDTKQYPNSPAVLQLHHYSWWMSSGDGTDEGLFYHPPEQDLTTFAHYYDIPSLSLRAATWHLQNLGIFKVDKVQLNGSAHYLPQPDGEQILVPIPAASPEEALQCFFYDAMHPSNKGHAALAELLSEPLRRALHERQTGAALTAQDRRGDKRLDELPPPMIPNSLDETPSLCAMLEDFKPLVQRTSGFEYKPERPQAPDFISQKWGWRGTEPGAWAELVVDTSSSGGDSGDTIVWLSHLRSYSGMGLALITCTKWCKCDPTLLDGTTSQQASIFWMTRFKVTPARACHIRVTISDQPGQVPQEGHKVMLAALMVTHVPLTGTLEHVGFVKI